MTGPMSMNRRQAALTFGALWTTLTIPAAAAAQAAVTLTWTPKALTPAQAKVLDAVAELIIPATETPGAREAGVAAFVDRAVADFCTPGDAQAICVGLDRIEADARASHGAAFTALAPEQQTMLLARYDAEEGAPQAAAIGRGDTETGLSNRIPLFEAPQGRPFFAVLKDLVTVGYFTSKPGATKALRYELTPGAYHGCVPLAQIGRAWAL